MPADERLPWHPREVTLHVPASPTRPVELPGGEMRAFYHAHELRLMRRLAEEGDPETRGHEVLVIHAMKACFGAYLT